MKGLPGSIDPKLGARAYALLDEAIDLDEASRTALLERIKSEDPGLAALLERLLEAIDRPSRLDRPLFEMGRQADRSGLAALDVGTRLGPWRIESAAGRGGMASVYRASRADGRYEQVVAIKLLDSVDPAFGRRFAREQAFLAALEHPNIARLLDAGQLPDGRPWLAMAWVEGHNLDAHLRETRPSLATRLEIFEQIASAVAYAHRHLIVHRDLKPSNVRVTPDGRAILLDFGIARLLTGGTTDVPTQTLLTPQYAAPEQFTGGSIGTWTDLHGLGLLLHEILTGRPAFPEARTSLASAVRAIVTDMPPAPSEAAHDADLPYPARVLRGDLDAIVARCLAKEPDARYASVDALLADLERHRRMLPVRARRGAWRYRATRWLQRNWLPASFGAVAGLSLIAAVVVFAVQAERIAAERDAARLEVRRQEALREHLALMLREGATLGASATVRQLLDRSAAQLDTAYRDRPDLRRSVLLAMGELYFLLGDMPAAPAMIERFLSAAGADTPGEDLALAHAQQAQVLLRMGDRDGARAEIEAAVALRGAAESHDVDAQILGARSQLARAEGDLETALALQRRAVDVASRAVDASPYRIGAIEGNLGVALLHAHRLDQARTRFESAWGMFERAGFGHSVQAITLLGHLASVEALLGRVDEAARHYAEGEGLADAAMADSAMMAALLHNHARLLLSIDRLDDALERARRAVALMERYVGADSVDAASVRLTLAEIAFEKGRDVDAQRALDQAGAVLVPRVPEGHPLRARFDLVAARLALARDPEASLAALADAIRRLEAAPPLLGRHLFRGAIWLSEAALARSEVALAEAVLTRVQSLPLFEALPEADRAEVQAWAMAAAAHRDRSMRAHLDEARARMVAAWGERHSRVMALDRAATRSRPEP